MTDLNQCPLCGRFSAINPIRYIREWVYSDEFKIISKNKCGDCEHVKGNKKRWMRT